ncbi:OB-fold protein [Polaribacter sp.]|uniref:OB-fold protein n=1 Tax=Polaribacter sp. TaxID=1920175 RepID=UPI003F6A5892
MKSIKNLFYTIIVILLFVNIYVYVLPFFKSSERNLEKVPSEIALNSNQLVNYYLENEKNANYLYTGKIIEVIGFVEDVSFLNDRNTVLLYTDHKKYGILCDVNNAQIEKVKSLKKHQKIKVKGICKGFLKDVVLLNCYIDLKPNE